MPDFTVSQLLHPKRFPGMSGMMAALVGHILGLKVTEPAIAELYVTSDSCVLARHEGDIGANDFIGSLADLERNWTGLLDAAGLTTMQRLEANAAFVLKTQRH